MTGKPSCLVLGANGFIGSAVCRHFSRQGWNVFPVTRENAPTLKNRTADVMINANGNSKKFLARENPREDFRASVESVLHSLLDFSYQSYVYLSSIDVYPNLHDPVQNDESCPIDPGRTSPYGLHKYLAEQLVQQYAPSWSILRMGGFVGPGLWKNPVYDLLHGHPLRVHPDSQYQYMSTEDLGSVIEKVIEGDGLNQLLNVVGTGTVALSEIASWLPQKPAVPDAVAKLRPEHYEINADRVNRLIPIAASREVLRSYVNSALQTPAV